MNIRKLILAFLFLTLSISSIYALQGDVATKDDMSRLKRDLRVGEIQVGQTRLKDIREKYGEAPTITATARRLVYNYGDLKIEFDKKRYWKDWEYDTFKDQAYSDDIDDLRYDLESDEIVGDNITFSRIRKDYDEPTESIETDADGELSIYYYGDIKMIFENFVVVRSWKGSNLEESEPEGVLQSKPNVVEDVK